MNTCIGIMPAMMSMQAEHWPINFISTQRVVWKAEIKYTQTYKLEGEVKRSVWTDNVTIVTDKTVVEYSK